MEGIILILAVLVVLQWLWNATLRGRVDACEWRVQLAESAVQEYRARVVAAEKVIVDATDQFGKARGKPYDTMDVCGRINGLTFKVECSAGTVAAALERLDVLEQQVGILKAMRPVAALPDGPIPGTNYHRAGPLILRNDYAPCNAELLDLTPGNPGA
jgi:hypothetical protein